MPDRTYSSCVHLQTADLADVNKRSHTNNRHLHAYMKERNISHDKTKKSPRRSKQTLKHRARWMINSECINSYVHVQTADLADVNKRSRTINGDVYGMFTPMEEERKMSKDKGITMAQ